jgi:hypothetical protein
MSADDRLRAWTTANQALLAAEFGVWKARLGEVDGNGVDATDADAADAAEADAQAALHAARGAMPARAPIDTLTDAFALSAFERSLLLLVAGAEMDAELADLCGHAVGQPQHPWATFGLALNLLPDPHWSALARTQPLRRWRLIEFDADAALVTARLRLDERVLHYLAGMNLMDARLLPLLRAVSPPLRMAASHEALAQAVARQLAGPEEMAQKEMAQEGTAQEGPARGQGTQGQGAQEQGTKAQGLKEPGSKEPGSQEPGSQEPGAADRSAPAPLIFFHGDDASGREDVAARCADVLGLRMHALNAQALPGSFAELADVAVLWEREAALGAGALLIDCDEEVGSGSGQIAAGSAATTDPSVMTRAKAFAEAVGGLIFMGARAPVALRRDTRLHAVDRPSAAEQRALWTAALGNAAAGHEADVEAVAGQFRLSARGIAGAAAAALAAPSLADGALWRACRERASASLGELAHRIAARARWDDLVLPAAQKATLGQIVAHVRHRRQVLETWGFADRGGRGLGITVLFAGDSGTGKTFAAEVLATELSLDLFRVDLSGVVSKYIGETEKNLRRVFDAAEESGAILLFDEADALFGKRSEVRDSHDRYANVEVSYLLQRMETYHGLAILTTNHKAALDSAFMRRLRFVVQFPFPETAEREAIWRRAFPQATPTDSLAFEKLARLQASGGQIQNMALGAAFLAAAEGGPVRMAHVLTAVRTDGTRFDRPVSDRETRGWV